MNTKDIGEKSEARAIFEFKSRGYAVLTPFGDNQPYDLVVDTGDTFLRVQVKTAWLDGDVVKFNTDRIPQRTDNTSKTYCSDEIDIFVAYCDEREECYLMDVDEAPNKRASLRIDAEVEYDNMRWATEHQIDNYVSNRNI